MPGRPDPILIPAGNPGSMTGSGNNTWLVDGVEPTLIDAGVGSPRHLSAIARALGSRALVRVLVTHSHLDHASDVPALAAAWPSTEACKLPLPGESGWRTLVDGQTIRAGDRWLEVVHTPGHAADHACFWDPDRRELFGGDMVLSGTTVMIPAGRGGNLRLYLASLKRLAALGPVRIYPGHGEVVDRPLEVIDGYLKRRDLRERQILQCLADGVTEVEAIVSRIYPAVPAALRQAACLTVAAHLEKIREDRLSG